MKIAKIGAKQIISIVVVIALISALTVGNFICCAHATEITTHLCPAEEIIDSDTLTDAQASSEEVVQLIAQEGMTLLKNNGTLPMAVGSKLNLFGVGSTSIKQGFFYAGLGSGAAAIQDAKKVTLQQGLESAGFEINDELLIEYADNKANFNESWYSSGNTVLSNAKAYSNTAVVTISRTTGENQGITELTTDTSPVAANGPYKDTEADGRNHLQLSLLEEAMLNYVCDNFSNVVVLINAGNTMELGYMNREEIDAVLYVSLPGQSGTKQIGNILCGEVNPSGHTSSTFSYNSKLDPTWANAIYTDSNGKQIAYAEDIYVGYKWYETADAEGYFDELTNEHGTGYDSAVQYPFGYGLSYTTFDWDIKGVKASVDGAAPTAIDSGYSLVDKDTEITVSVEVTNTGDVAGKDVVELYYTAPYYKGGLEKAHVNLVGFAKTDMIEAGESDTIEVTFEIYDMASYDCYDANGNSFCGWELDPGKYEIKLMTDAHTLKGENTYFELNVANEGSEAEPFGFSYLFDTTNTSGIVLNRFTGEDAENNIPIDGNNNGSKIVYLSRSDFGATFPLTAAANRTSGANACQNAGYYTGWDSNPGVVPELNNTDSQLYLYTLEDGSKADLASLEATTSSASKIIPNLDLIKELGSNYDSPLWTKLLSQLSMDEIDLIVSTAGFGTTAAASIGKPSWYVSDGPSGFNKIMTSIGSESIYTGYPVETLIGMTWNVEVARLQGAAIGEEAMATGHQGIYAPTVNLQRSAYNTRNYETYSEDGVLSGYLASGFIIGAKTHGCQTALKHLVLSEPGANPNNLNTWLTEQNLRENYLKPFEIAVKDGGANFVMTAFNNIGGIRCAYSYELINNILRQEWGFVGSVITDYGVGSPEYLVRAGNDLLLNPNASKTGTLSADNAADIVCGVQAVKNDIYTFCNTYYSTLTYNPDTTFSTVTRIQPFVWWIPALIFMDVTFLALGTIIIIKALRPSDKKHKSRLIGVTNDTDNKE